jgi:hypothetical protein
MHETPEMHDPREMREMRQEPGREPAATEPAREDSAGAHGYGVEMEGYLRRFEAVQSEFIDEPRRAVENAKSLVQEAIDRMMSRLHQEAGEGDDTERLRITLKRYRDVLHTFGERMR